MRLRKLLAIALAAAMLVSMAACGSTPAPEQGENPATQQDTTQQDSTQTEEAEPALDQDQYYTVSLTEPASLDAGKSSDIYAHSVMVDIYEPLCRLENGEDGVNVLKEAGAESWTSNEDGTVWTFTIRDNTWSDGVPVTAKDYEYGIKRTADPATGSPNSFFLSPLKNADAVMKGEMPVDELGVRSIDDKTLEITLEHPTPWFLSLTYQKAMMPQRQDIVEKYGETYGAEANTLVCNGPFLITTWTHNSEILLEKNPNYWDAENVKLQRINYKILTDENALLNSLDNGSIDAAGVTKQEWKERFNARDDLSYVTYPKPQLVFNFFNVDDPIMGNANIRKAIALGLDLDEFNEVVYKGVNIPAYGWVPPGVDMGDLGPYRDLAEEPMKKLAADNPDPKALLLKGMEELGLGDDPSTLPISLSIGGTDQWYRTFGEYMQQALKASLGINLEIQMYEWPSFMASVESGDYQIGNMSWMMDYNEPMGMLELMKSTSTSIKTNWVNEEYDKLIDQATLELDDAKRLELYKQAENILLYEDCVIAPSVYTQVSTYRYKFVKGIPTDSFTSYSQGLKHAYTAGREK